MISKTIVFNDLHRPFHDPKAVKIVLDVAEDANVDRIVINGDLLDMYSVNSHGPTHPLVGTMLCDEVEDSRLWLQALRKRFPKQEIVFLFGNHEDRFERFMVNYCKKLFEFVSLHKLLGLEQLDISWEPYNARYQLEKSNVYIQHSPPSYSKNGAMVSLERDIDQTTIYGCSHRELKASKSGKSGKNYYCFFNGWLGSTNMTEAHRKVFKYVKGHESWQQCFCMVTVDKKKTAYVEQVSINDGKAIYNGKIYG